MYRLLIIMSIFLIIFVLYSTGYAQSSDKTPEITAFLAMPTNGNQCQPVKLAFTLTNDTSGKLTSHPPYSGSYYNLNQTYLDKDTSGTTKDTYTVAISLNNGKDNYPYRWGFKGTLLPGKTSSIIGYIMLIQPGNYKITPAIIHNEDVIESVKSSSINVTISECDNDVSYEEPVDIEPVSPVIEGNDDYEPLDTLMQDGHLLVAVRPFFYNLGASTYYEQNAIVVEKPGLEMTLFPNTRDAIINGTPVTMPYPTYTRNGVAYVPPRFIMPFFGANVYYDTRFKVLFIGTGVLPGW